MRMTITALKKEFKELYGHEGDHPIEYFFSPGRVCLVGEHIDYNGGDVMPAAISRGTYAVFRRTNNNIVWMRSTLDKHDVVIPLHDNLLPKEHYGWGNYPLAMIHMLRKQGHELTGCEVLFHSDMPVGAGLSSSASVQVLTGYMFNRPETEEGRIELAVLAQKAERDVLGLNCGIMDQFAVAMSRRDHLLRLNCGTLNYQQLPLLLEDHSLVVFNTNKPRKLVESKYNERVAECDQALEILKRSLRIDHLAQADEEAVMRLLRDPIIQNRALHVVGEQQRVDAAARALQNNDIKAFGNIMTASHRSLSELYEVAGLELDTMVIAALRHEGCLGAKMTGGGFGGCAVAIVEKDAVESLIEDVLYHYNSVTGYTGEAFEVSVNDGVGRVSEEGQR